MARKVHLAFHISGGQKPPDSRGRYPPPAGQRARTSRLGRPYGRVVRFRGRQSRRKRFALEVARHMSDSRNVQHERARRCRNRVGVVIANAHLSAAFIPRESGQRHPGCSRLRTNEAHRLVAFFGRRDDHRRACIAGSDGDRASIWNVTRTARLSCIRPVRLK